MGWWRHRARGVDVKDGEIVVLRQIQIAKARRPELAAQRRQFGNGECLDVAAKQVDQRQTFREVIRGRPKTLAEGCLDLASGPLAGAEIAQHRIQIGKC